MGKHRFLRGNLLPNFIISNPLGAASVNGIWITPEGEYLAALKRNKTAGTSISPIQENTGEFGKGVICDIAIRDRINDKTIKNPDNARDIVKLLISDSKGM